MKRLRELRESRNLTTKQLASIVGCTNPTITNYELGYREPDLSMITKLADYFNVSVDYLIGHEDKEKKSVDRPTPLEWTDEDKALGVGSHPTVLSEEEWEWIELRSEALRLKGREYVEMLERMIKAAIELK